MTDPQELAAEETGQPEQAQEDQGVNRREFLTNASNVAMAGGVVCAYGALGAMAARFLYPSNPQNTQWMFVVDIARMEPGDSMTFASPAGEKIAITRQGDTGTKDDFIALSSVCPHLGCQVHWEPHNNRFYCPCHNGIFDATGKATEGPPADAGQSLLSYPLDVRDGMLFIEAPLEKTTLS